MGSVIARIPTEKHLIEAYTKMLNRYEEWNRSLPKHATHEEGCDYGEWVDIMNDRKRNWNGYTQARDLYHVIAAEFCRALKRRGMSYSESLTELHSLVKAGVKQ